MSSSSSTGPEAEGTGGEDHTLDPAEATPGQFAFQYGYIPCVVFGVSDDGQVEVARFAGFEYLDPRDLSSKRGPLPTDALPPPPDPGDRIAGLERQVETLLGILKGQGTDVSAVSEAKSSEAAAPGPAPVAVESPFGQVA